LRAFTALSGGVYVLNMLLLSGIGRFHGSRYMAVEPLAQWIGGWRMALGFDATLLLAALNALIFVCLLMRLEGELAALGAASGSSPWEGEERSAESGRRS
jgi:cyanate permease